MSFVGYSVLFSGQLLPSFEGFSEGVESGGYWCFEEAFGKLISKVKL